MTDVPSGTGGPGAEADPYVPTGARRSTFTPPGSEDTSGDVDDDALAEAMAAEVAAYTSPVSIIPPVAPLKAPEPPPVEPADEPAAAAEPDETPSIPTPTLETSMSPTLEAIERLESELRRRADEVRAAVTPPPTFAPPASEPPASAPSPYPDAPLFPSPPTFLRPAPPEGFGPPAEPQVSEPAPSEPGPSEPELSEPAPPEAGPWEPEPWEPEPPLAEPAEPPEWAPSAFGAPPPLVEPPAAVPPPLVEPGTLPTGPAFGPESVTPGFEPPPYEPPAFDVTDFDAPEFDRAAPDRPVFDVTVPDAPVFDVTVPEAPAVDEAPFEPAPFEPPSFVAPPPHTAPVDLPPPTTAPDFAHLPPPIGLQPAPLPPYDPATDFAVPEPHPDDLGGGESIPPAPSAPPPSAALSFDIPPPVTSTEDDDVDEVDRAFGTGAIPVDGTGSVRIIAPPSEPIPTVRLADDESALVDEEPESHPALLVEAAGPEPTPLDLRAGRAARMFWLWFAANSSVVSLALGAVLFGLGMSLRQALVAIFIGVALSCLPLGLVTLAGKWSGQPTMVVSRATFGLVGNGLPAVLSVISRVFWGGALLWVLAAGVASVLVDAGLDAGLGEQVWTIVGLAAGFALAFVVAIFGYGLIARVQLVLSILTAVLVVGVVVLTFPRLDIAAAQSIDDGPWLLLVTGVVLVFSFVGLAWVHSSADVARYQRTESDGGSTMLWAIFGATLPALILVAWGALLAASDPLIADGLATDPLYTIAALLPLWYPAPLLAALALGLLSGVVLTIYSGGFALLSLGIPARRSVMTAIAGVLVLAAAGALLFLAGDARGLIVDIATTIAVPVAAWAGIFGAEVMIRRRGFDADSLLQRGGVYPAVRWVNLVGLVVISAIGFGLSSAAIPGLDWQGFLLPFLGLPDGDPLLTSDVGVLVALALGLLLPLATAVPAIRRQEAADQNLRS
jgi:purine-cytosine permease-like protein